ncbi:MAG: hypothetical protein G3M78_05140 [Candidatus Nitrohelix vancouverensis]|uniref:Uncharacterized protein n=1 Tax=Candidatus Nitrohelix vancouverensis TaxID=2705534 RepID=A0A7T0C1I0_9BACT|nr:MAG: hypothetical protein G3M78_05140 [Candidatus Nitrohelix vancouverensis]
MKRSILFFGFLSAILFATTASAASFHCSDYRGDRVDFRSSPEVTKIAIAGYSFGGNPVIWENDGLGAEWDSLMKQYAYYYECGRHVVGNTLRDNGHNYESWNQVSLADCWAASKLVISEGVSKEDIEALQTQLNEMEREQWARFPGPVRVLDLVKDCRI